jgi:hypothetical protein
MLLSLIAGTVNITVPVLTAGGFAGATGGVILVTKCAPATGELRGLAELT